MGATTTAKGERLFADLVEPLYADPAVTPSTMMGLPCVRYDGRFFASLDRRSGALLVKLPADRVRHLVERGEGEHFTPAGRTFREWVSLPNPDPRRWRRHLAEAIEFVRADGAGAPQPASRPPLPGFEGFPEEGFGFLAGLEANNTKAYFDANRDTYERTLLEPAKAFVTALGAQLRARVSPDIQAEPRVGASLFRINNDLRFAKHLRPYKTTLDMTFWEGDAPPRQNPALMLRLTTTEVHLGAGVFGLAGDRLEHYRRALRDDRRSAELHDAVVAVTRRGGQLSEPTRKRLPAGFHAETTAASYAVRDGFHVTTRSPRPAERTSPRFVDWCATRLEPFGPIHRWLVGALSHPGVAAGHATRRPGSA